MAHLLQCIRCGFLENGYVDMIPCSDGKDHNFKPLSRETVASALGSYGGRPKTYKTPALKRAAVKRNQKRFRERRAGPSE